MAKLVQLIEIDLCRGEGSQSDPCRTVMQWWTTDGKLIAEDDPVASTELRRFEEFKQELARTCPHYNPALTLSENWLAVLALGEKWRQES